MKPVDEFLIKDIKIILNQYFVLIASNAILRHLTFSTLRISYNFYAIGTGQCLGPKR